MPKKQQDLRIIYFGNLGVGRINSVQIVAEELQKLDAALKIDVYGAARKEDVSQLGKIPGVQYHGFVSAEQLHRIIAEADILLHVESFDPQLSKKLCFAFSTKIAQCLCAGRCFLTFAPMEIVSTQYLCALQGGAAVASDRESLRRMLQELIEDVSLRCNYAKAALDAGKRNHDVETTATFVRKQIEQICQRSG